MGVAGMSMTKRYDPLSEGQLDNPYGVYAEAREHEPVFYSDNVVRGRRVWVLTRYADIRAVAADDCRFSSREALLPLVPIWPETEAVLRDGYPLRPTIVETDGDRHSRVSVPLGQFLNRGARDLQPFIEATVDRLIDEMTAGRRRGADLIWQFAHQLPFAVVNHLYGVPETDYEQIAAWCDSWMRFLSTDLTAWDNPEAEQVRAVQGMQEYFGYMAELVGARRRQPRPEDLVTVLTQHREGDFEPLDNEELVCNLGGVLLAGHVTVTALIGNLAQILLSPAHRHYWDHIVAHPADIPGIVNEGLRFRNPNKAFFRTAAEETVVGGVTIPAGGLVQLLFGSANHDAAVWQDPEVFNPWAADRQPGKLMSFGHGLHRCLGAALARAEAKIALGSLSRRLPELRLVPGQELHRMPTVILDGLLGLPVQW
jgi:cytochrome P450